MLSIYAAIGRTVSWKFHLMVFFGSQIVPIIVFFLADAIEFGAGVYFFCTIVAPGVVVVVVDGVSMEDAPCLLLECVNLILEP
jgi:hypothetical protein